MSYQNITNSQFATSTFKKDDIETNVNPQVQPAPYSNDSTRQTTMPPTPPVSPAAGKSHLPAFLNKLYGMVTAPETDPWVHWSDNGTSFIIPNSQALAQQILGRHFKHNNFPSFVRQLNMYGFHKVPHLNHGVLHNDGLPEVWEFVNPNFRRDAPDEMKRIIRKKGEAEKARSVAKQQHSPITPISPSSTRLSDPADIAIVRAELHQLASRQNMIRDELLRLSSSTEGLWKYALETRLRYEQQQLKLDNIIRVLSDVFRKQRPNSELPSKIRGYLEAPQTPLADASSSAQPAAACEPSQQEVMKMLANGKVPAGFNDAFQNYLSSVSQTSSVQQPSTPASHASPTTHDSPEDVKRAQDDQQQVQDWLNNTNQYLEGLGIDFNPAGYGDYLVDSTLAYDPFAHQSDLYNVSALPSSWMHNAQAPEMSYSQDTPTVGQKRAFQHEEDESQSAQKRSRN